MKPEPKPKPTAPRIAYAYLDHWHYLSCRVKVTYGVLVGVPICTQPTSQPNRITLHIPTGTRIIGPKVIIVKPRFLIKILSGKTDILFNQIEKIRVQVRFVKFKLDFTKPT